MTATKGNGDRMPKTKNRNHRHKYISSIANWGTMDVKMIYVCKCGRVRK